MCHILRLNAQKNPISTEALPQTPLGSLQHSPDLLAGFKGPTSKGGEGSENNERRGERSVNCGVHKNPSNPLKNPVNSR